MTTSEEFTEAKFYQPKITAWRDVWRLGVAAIAAIFSGFVCEQGWPGSIIALVPAFIFSFLILRQSFKGWSRSTKLVACLNVVSLCAVVIEPGPLNLAIEWITLSSFAFVQHDGVLDNLLNIGKAAASSLLKTPMNVLNESRKMKALRDQSDLRGKIFSFANILLPVIAIFVFGALLIIANPLIEQSVSQLSWLDPSLHLWTWMPLISVLSFIITFAVLKLKPLQNQNIAAVSQKLWAASFFKPMPVIFTLLILNFMFAAENFLDLLYLWSGTTLPSGMNYAEYVHRGSYTLIVTAVLAGALMIFALQPGSQGEKSKLLRGLVYLWTLQNLFLVASSAKRTLDYVDAYGMTVLRFSGLVWMAVVAAGLILIVFRVLRRKGNVWLVNANFINVYLVLLTCGYLNFSAITANWNVERAFRHLRNGDYLNTLYIDMNYLQSLQSAALPALQRLYDATAVNRDKFVIENYHPIFQIIGPLKAELHERQTNWRTWTLRGLMLETQ